MRDILERLAQSSPDEGSHELYCRCLDAAAEISRLRALLTPLLLLAQDVRLIDAEGTLPDGDGVNIPTVLWAEEWVRKLAAVSPEAGQ